MVSDNYGRKATSNVTAQPHRQRRYTPNSEIKDLITNAVNSVLGGGEAYNGASQKTSLKGWPTSYQSAVADDIPALVTLRSRSRDINRNTPIGAALIERDVTNVVGAGLIFQSRIKRDQLKLTDEEADLWESETESRFQAFAENKDIDIERTSNFYELTDLSFRSTLISGDCFVLMPRIEGRNKLNTLCFALYEGDYVATPSDLDNLVDLSDESKIAGGIEIDKNGAPEFAYFFKSHPGDLGFTGIDDFTKVPFFGKKSGRKNILHLMFKKRPKQRRGIPSLAPIIDVLKQITRYTESELVAAVINSFLTVFITKDGVDQSGLGIGSAITGDQSILSPNEPTDANQIELGSGTTVELEEGEDIKVVDPSRPNKEFNDFVDSGLKQLGAGYGIPFEILVQHFTSSYSASRAALLEFWKFVTTRRNWIVTNFCKPAFEEWLTIEIMEGRIIAPGYFDDEMSRRAWSGSKWNGTVSKGMIDPLKETNASVKRIDNNLSTHEKEFLSQDTGDWRSEMFRKAKEKKLIAKLGIKPIDLKEVESKMQNAEANTEGDDDA